MASATAFAPFVLHCFFGAFRLRILGGTIVGISLFFVINIFEEYLNNFEFISFSEVDIIQAIGFGLLIYFFPLIFLLPFKLSDKEKKELAIYNYLFSNPEGIKRNTEEN